MVEYLKYFNAMLSNRLITPIWREVLILLNEELDESERKDDFLILFAMLFALTDDGNICMSLNKAKLTKKWNDKLEGTKILLSELDKLDVDSYNYVVDKSNEVINNSLEKMNDETLSSVVGNNKFFEIEDEWIYLRKNNVARKSLLVSIDRLFNVSFDNIPFDYLSAVDTFRLTSGQEKVVEQGINKNLVITGGPGTGKTTSILFLLLGLLISHQYDEVYLLAPSGKAASRMKDSIKGGLDVLNKNFVEKYKDIVDRIANLRRFTIHSALGIDSETNGFKHNEKHQLASNSIFIIDEASMIDVCLFASLLSAIPDGSRVFVMGDKNQLPSVDAGAVFGELIVKQSLLDNGNICELGEAVRFKIGSPIYVLANAINNESEELPTLDWKDEILEIQSNSEGVINPVYYYSNPINGLNISEKEIIQKAVINFGKAYYQNLQERCTNLDPNKPEELKALFSSTVKNAEILCAENQGNRGVETINALAKAAFIDKKKPTSVEGFYPGELMMINKNNKLLDLANGDSGVLVTFAGDKTLYFMIEKDSELVKTEKKIDGKIFKLGGYMFYPFRLITRAEIDSAYAITIHKSQGSDYKNILVILPNKKGHPLLNRQIVYTAITRTKGDTYILSNQDRILDAKNTIIKRDTNIK